MSQAGGERTSALTVADLITEIAQLLDGSDQGARWGDVCGLLDDPRLRERGPELNSLLRARLAYATGPPRVAPKPWIAQARQGDPPPWFVWCQEISLDDDVIEADALEALLNALHPRQLIALKISAARGGEAVAALLTGSRRLRGLSTLDLDIKDLTERDISVIQRCFGERLERVEIAQAQAQPPALTSEDVTTRVEEPPREEPQVVPLDEAIEALARRLNERGVELSATPGEVLINLPDRTLEALAQVDMNLEDVLRALKRGTLRKITSLGNIAQDELRAHLELITDEGVEAYLFGDEGAPPNVLAVVRAFLGRCEPFSRLLIIKAYRDLLSTDDLSESLGRAREIVARRLDDILSGGAKRFGELLRAHLQEISLTAALNHGLIEVTRACQLVSAGEEAPSPWELRLALDLAGEPHKIFGEVLLLLDKKQDLIGIHARLQTLEDLQSLQQIQRHLVEGEELRLDLDALAVLLDDVLEYERPDGLSWREARALITPEEHTESAPDDEATLLAPESAPEDLGAGAEDNAPSTSAEERSYAKEDPLTLADGIQLARGSIGISEFFLQELIAEAVDKVHDDHPVTIAALLRRLGGVAGGAFLMHREHGAAILSALLSSAGELNVSSATPPADSLVRCAENTPPSLDAAPAPQAHVASPPPKAAVETTSPPQTAPNPQTIALLRRHLIRELEELQRGPATPFVWEETCAVVDQLLTFMPFVEVEALLSLERFPDEVRVAPSFWSRAFANARVTWLPLIKHLHLGDRTLTEAPFLTAQETAFTLNSVGFERCSFAPGALADALQTFRDAEYVGLNGCDVERAALSAAFRAVRGARHERVYLSSMPVDVLALRGWIPANLRALALASCALCADDIETLNEDTIRGRRLTVSDTLHLEGDPIGDEAFSMLGRGNAFGHIKRLALRRARLSPEALRRASWPTLDSLDLSENVLGDEGAEALGNDRAYANLRELRLAAAAITSDGLKALSKGVILDGIRVLDLSGNPISDVGAGLLARSPLLAEVETLDLRGCGVSEAGLDELRSSYLLRRANIIVA